MVMNNGNESYVYQERIHLLLRSPSVPIFILRKMIVPDMVGSAGYRIIQNCSFFLFFFTILKECKHHLHDVIEWNYHLSIQ